MCRSQTDSIIASVKFQRVGQLPFKVSCRFPICGVIKCNWKLVIEIDNFLSCLYFLPKLFQLRKVGQGGTFLLQHVALKVKGSDNVTAFLKECCKLIDTGYAGNGD